VGVGEFASLAHRSRVFTAHQAPTGAEIVGVDRNHHLLHLVWDTVEGESIEVARCV